MNHVIDLCSFLVRNQVLRRLLLLASELGDNLHELEVIGNCVVRKAILLCPTLNAHTVLRSGHFLLLEDALLAEGMATLGHQLGNPIKVVELLPAIITKDQSFHSGI